MARRPRLDRLYSSNNSNSNSSSTVDRSTEIRSIAFGTFPAPDSFAGEWEREGRGGDRMLWETATKRKDGRTTLVIRMWEDSNPFSNEPSTQSSIRISIEVRFLLALFSRPLLPWR
jgi:hypothetical protein